jgi:hypothetical protein
MFSIAACTPSDYWKLRLEIPGAAGLSLDPYDELIVTDFLVREKNGKFDISKEIGDYFSYEFGLNLDKTVTKKPAGIESDETFQDSEFWKSLYPEINNFALLTGAVEYEEETRKALIRQEKRRFEDPFPQEQSLATRTFYTLTMDVYIIEGSTGKILYQNNYKETRSYKNPNQTAYFAFFDLIQDVRDKIFSTVLGSERVQQRYLISR